MPTRTTETTSFAGKVGGDDIPEALHPYARVDGDGDGAPWRTSTFPRTERHPAWRQ